MLIKLVSKFILLFWGHFLFHPFIEAIPGRYVTLPILEDKRMPNDIAKYALRSSIPPIENEMEDACRGYCYKNLLCNAYSISEFERKCLLHVLVKGERPVHYLGSRVYLTTKSEADGYFIYKMDYIKVHFQLKNQFNSNEYCKTLNGTLVAIRDEELNNLLRKVMETHIVFKIQIGLTDEEVEGDWKYLDGEPATYTNFDYKGTWNREDENCAYMASSGYWFQINCGNPQYFACQTPMF